MNAPKINAWRQAISTLIITHLDCLAHDPGPDHPDTSARLTAILEVLRAPAFAALTWAFAPLVEETDLERVHSREYIGAVGAAIPRKGLWNLDPDTIVSPRSDEAARRAAGAGCAAVDALYTGEADNVFGSYRAAC